MNYILQPSYDISSDGVQDLVKFVKEGLSKAPYKFAHSFVDDISSDDFDGIDIEYLKDSVPIGDLNYVRKYLEFCSERDRFLSPIEVPDFLRTDRYLKRKYKIVSYEEAIQSRGCFIKDATVLKNFYLDNDSCFSMKEEVMRRPDFEEMKMHEYVVSESVEIESEYRVFVCRDKAVDCRRYSGDALLFPDSAIMLEIISEIWYNRRNKNLDLPCSYTLDIGVSKERGTFIIEMHNFVSCGLYGFNSLDDILTMLSDGIDFERKVK